MRDRWSKDYIWSNTLGMLALTAGVFVFVVILEVLFPDLIPFGMWDMWQAGSGDIFAAIESVKPLFLVPILLNTLAFFVIIRANKELPVFDLGDVFHISIRAGVLEEIIFRWLSFYTAIAFIRIVDFLFFRALFGFSIDEFIYTTFLMPLADTATLHKMTDLIYPAMGWFVGAGMISVNGKFRDGHMYQGLLGWVLAWFGGMILFYVAFTYGLLAAIVVHVVYDVVALGVVWLLRVTFARNYVPEPDPFANLFSSYRSRR